MTLYLTDKTPPEEVARAREAGIVAFKLYPAGATTNSDSGVTSVENVMPTLRAMSEVWGFLARKHNSCLHCTCLYCPCLYCPCLYCFGGVAYVFLSVLYLKLCLLVSFEMCVVLLVCLLLPFCLSLCGLKVSLLRLLFSAHMLMRVGWDISKGQD